MPRYQNPKKEQSWRDAISKKVTKLTPEVIQKLREAFLIDCTIEEACFYAQIAIQTYYNWIQKNPELLDEFTECRQRPILKARQNIIESIESKDKNMSVWYLEKKLKNEFIPQSKVEHSGAIGTSNDPSNSEISPEMSGELNVARENYLKSIREIIKKNYKDNYKENENNPGQSASV